MEKYIVSTRRIISHDLLGTLEVEDGDDCILIKQRESPSGCVIGAIELNDPAAVPLLIDALKHISRVVWGKSEDG
jgi:hypothetical protein